MAEAYARASLWGMRFVVVGAGAVGGVVGGRLFEHGHDVVLVARGEHGQVLANRGLTLEWPGGSATLPVPAVGHPAEVDLTTGDVVLLAVKGQDTATALRDLAASAPPGVAVVCLQNGVDNERVALRHFADVYGVPVMCPTEHLEPGVVRAYSAPVTGILDIGRWPAGTDVTADAVAAAFRTSTFESEVRVDVARWKYAKLLTNLANAVDAVCDRRDAEELMAAARREGEACLRAAGIDFASAAEDRARRGDTLTLHRVDGDRRLGGSTWQSLARGTGAVEVDHLNGEIVLLGRLHGVPTPVNAMLQLVANEMAAARRPPGSLSVDDLMARIGAAGGA
jgi:2-dehydropantoate 2-reductase